MKFLVVAADRSDGYKSLFNISMKKIGAYSDSIPHEFEWEIIQNNTEGLSKAYNSIINREINFDVDWIIFTHSDLYIDDVRIFDKLTGMHEYADIVGLAGTNNIKPLSDSYPKLWHTMAKQGSHRGYVMHFQGEDNIFATNFGITPAPVKIIDGVFIAVKLQAIKDANWRFNENYNFHHYDISASLDALKAGLRIWVAPINAIHKSHGLSSIEDKNWKESNLQFEREYGSYRL